MTRSAYEKKSSSEDNNFLLFMTKNNANLCLFLAPAFEGRKEIWDALRGACYAIEQNDIDLAQSSKLVNFFL